MSSVETATLFPVDSEEYGKGEYRRKIEPEAEFDGDLWTWKGEAWTWPDFEEVALSACPFTPGQVLAVQEEWADISEQLAKAKALTARWNLGPVDTSAIDKHPEIIFKRDYPKGTVSPVDWQPASTLPLWAVRRFEQVTAVSVEGGESVVKTEEVPCER